MRKTAVGTGAALAVCGLAAAGLWVALPFPRPLLDPPPASTLITDRAGRPLRLLLSGSETVSRPVNLSQTGRWLAGAVVAAEDKRFRRHPGIDPAAALRALGANLRSGRIVSGASTLSTLVVKLATARRRRSLGAKISEGFRALQMERIVSKDRILEEYLNRAPFGGNLVGAEAAAERYFGRPAAALSLGEAALLAGIPQAPERWRPDRHPGPARERRDWVLSRMERLGVIGPREARAARDEPVLSRAAPFAFAAPHFCESIPRELLVPGTLRTTLDPRLQALAEAAIRVSGAELARRGAVSGAAVIIHVPTGEVRALVGSPDYFARPAGQVNCAAARRSAGSTLKPFIYCAAFDLGLASPGTRLADTPLDRGGYRPRNYGSDYSGPLSARAALLRSLNIPAIRLLERIGVERMLGILARCGFTTLNRPPGEYGLALAAGGGEVTLLELTNAAAVLARGGRYLPWRMTFSPPPPPRKVFSPEACWLVSEILSDPSRLPPGTAGESPAGFAWKTGTSNGHRDAWTVAWNEEYALGVWFGNPDGTPAEALVGVEAAAPAAAALFRGLYPQGAPPPPPPPPGCRLREICAFSGLPAGKNCSLRDRELFIPGVSPARTCRLCQAGKAELPAAPAAAGRPRIVSPRPGAIRLLAGRDGALPLRAELAGAGTEARLYWFANGKALGTTRPGEECFWTPSPGTHTIACALRDGGGDSVRITVEN